MLWREVRGFPKEQIDIEECLRELKCLLSLNDLAPRTEYKSLLNENLDKRKKALSATIDYLQALSDCGFLELPVLTVGERKAIIKKSTLYNLSDISVGTEVDELATALHKAVEEKMRGK